MALTLLSDDDRITVTDADLVEGGDSETTYTLRPVTRDLYQKATSRHASRIGGRRALSLHEQIALAVAVSEELLDYALVEWSGILVHGEPVPCETGYKKLLDGERVQALLGKAGVNQVKLSEEARAASFRGPA
jgi:hypothetical protein